MGFWIEMLLVGLILPVGMLIFGIYCAGGGPKAVNWWFGYRSPRSKTNRDTWQFAHIYFGKLARVYIALPYFRYTQY